MEEDREGAAEIVAQTCNFMLNPDGEPVPFTKADQEHVNTNIIAPFATDGLRCIALAIRDFEGEEVQLQGLHACTSAFVHLFICARMRTHM